MPNYFVTDANGTKRGPITPQQLKALADQGRITPNTPLETDTGQKGLAGQLRGLFDAPPPPDPFAEFYANQTATQSVIAQTTPIAPKNNLPSGVIIAIVAVLVVGGLIGGIALMTMSGKPTPQNADAPTMTMNEPAANEPAKMVETTPQLVISEETTRITEPLTAEGYIDFFKALEQHTYPPEIATDDNGFRIFVRLFGDVGEMSGAEFYRRQKYEKLGLNPNTRPTLNFPDEPNVFLDNFFKASEARGESVPDQRQIADIKHHFAGRPWTLQEYPMFAGWINEINDPMDAIAEAIRKPVFFFPLIQSQESVQSGKPQSLIDMLLPDVQNARSIARLFSARAMHRVGQGNIDGAIADKLTIRRLGRQVAQAGPLVQYLVGIAIEGMAQAIPVGGNPRQPLTEQQIRHILAELDALPPRAPLNNAFEFERYLGLDAVQSFHIAVSEGRTLGSAFSALLATMLHQPESQTAPQQHFLDPFARSINWNTVYRQMNEVYDALQEPSPRAKYHAMLKEAETIVAETRRSGGTSPYLSTPDGRDTLHAKMLISLLLPHVDTLEGAAKRSECMDNMQRLTLAILLYRLENRRMPDQNWAIQIQKYLGENPERYFSCPSNPAPRGQTTYAMVLYGNSLPTDPDTILLVEIAQPLAYQQASVTVDMVLQRRRMGSSHPGGMNVAYRSGVVRYMSQSVGSAELIRLLGR